MVAAEPVTSIDVTSADMLSELGQTLAAAGIDFHLAEVKGPVKDKLRRFGLLKPGEEQRIQPTVGAAVDTYLPDYQIDWKR